MKIGELEVSFEPYELPEDYKFVYKIKCCEHKIGFDTNTIVDKILSTRTKIVDEEVIRHLKNIGEEKGINELILIDESKVLKIIKSLKALEIIKKYPYELTTALAQPSYEMYCLWFKNFKSVRPKLSEAQYNLIRSVMCEDK